MTCLFYPRQIRDTFISTLAAAQDGWLTQTWRALTLLQDQGIHVGCTACQVGHRFIDLCKGPSAGVIRLFRSVTAQFFTAVLNREK